MTPVLTQIICILITLISAAGVLYFAKKTRVHIVITLLPLSILLGFKVNFLLGGFSPTFGFGLFVITSLLLSMFTVLSYFSWNNPVAGGITYICFGIFYTLISISRVASGFIVLVLGVFITTGLLLIAGELIQRNLDLSTSLASESTLKSPTEK